MIEAGIWPGEEMLRVSMVLMLLVEPMETMTLESEEARKEEP